MKSVIKNFWIGFSCAFTGLYFLSLPAIRKYLVIPMLINGLIFGGGTWLFINLIENITSQLVPGWLHWLDWLIWPFALISLAVGVYFSFGLIANLVAAPFTGFLSEKLEEVLKDTPLLPQRRGIWWYLKNNWLAVKTQLSIFIYMGLWAGLLIILSFIPGIVLFLPFTWILFSGWMHGLGYLSIPTSNHGLTFDANKRLINHNKSMNFGFGLGMTIITLTPILNIFSISIGSASATYLWVSYLQQDANLGNSILDITSNR